MSVTSEEAWTRYHDRLLGYIRARSRSAQDAEDILQDVFVKVHRRVGTLEDDAHVGAWLYRVTHNTIVDYYRKAQPLPTVIDPASVPADEIPVAEQRLAPFLTGLVDELPDIYREALILTELEGLTQTEMAHRLGLTPSGAKSRVQRGRAMLREQLLACCEVELDCRNHVMDYESRTSEPWPAKCPCAPEQHADRHQLATK
jgi:RNA polymerase sigma-70 factor (ECF subfamily)